ncbi:MAG: peptidase T [Bacteroidaceae bacterium]|nr:peptidase T [Bacteroidaceae bacterium]
MDITERFLNYVRFDTQSSEDSENTPSTARQWAFAEYLRDELKSIGLEDVELDEHAYLFATLPANSELDVPVVGFIAHMDTSPDCSGADVRPRIVRDYDGGDIVLSDGMVSSPSRFPELLNHIGEDIIVTDGHTLLGADDKAGIAEIVQAMVYLKEHSEIKHGKVRVGFNPDEEIGMGAHKFDVDRFGCDFAYTMDGSEVGEIEFENFNAASAKIRINGVSVHPGYSKGKMINAGRVATELVQLLPQDETPETTEGYEGFYHLTGIQGGCESATLSFIIRDHDRTKFEQRKQRIVSVVESVNEKYGDGVAALELKDQYYNMREMVEPKMYIIDIAKEAMKETGIVPKIVAIRGGTDGAQLSFKGLPCPNLFAGGINFHGPFEFCPVQSMEKAMMTIVNIVKGVVEL